MSQSELERFAAAIQANPSLGEHYRDITTPAELAARLRADGYDVTDTELEEIERAGSDAAGAGLSDGQLDGVAGGNTNNSFIWENPRLRRYFYWV